MKSQTASQVTYRPVDLAREHGLSTQAVRNYERDGCLPAAARTASGYRVYTAAHAHALRAYVALIPAHGYAAAGDVMRAANAGDLDAVLRAVDRGHAQLQRDRETLDAVEVAVTTLATPAPPAATAPAAHARPARPLTVGDVAHRLGVTPATLRTWERAGILTPRRDPVSHHRLYDADDVRDAQLAQLLRRGGYLLGHIAEVVGHVRATAGPAPLDASLRAWRQGLAARGRAMLTAAGRLADYLRFLDGDG
ncbi:MerR family DNA-binding transcriptional regulator [Dactylosporangium aurantiacum]|uniref:MerR family DNA-binding transcriptional regulator n=1 Tax=Dactylosporangium aurantiacum TaxID=35754 RepID=A0A9Q9IPX5_9ACTN|nr:MerR family transcriptional regulator [Dactylosporangium aurantiacum]MDG6103207.1 MerR family DNA-binding transcriptional regulator [Dactylosporangium aurantiacum]UWZ57712.1 MerR family DNA-binding transcriptional regulator [Dactylosporangium aurantiacum]